MTDHDASSLHSNRIVISALLNSKIGRRSVCIFLLFMILFFVPVTAANQYFSPTGTANASSDVHYFITIDPIGNHSVSDVFFVNGTSNLPVGVPLIVETPESRNKHQSFEWHLERNTSVQQGNSGVNIWSCNISPVLWETYGASHDIRQFETGQRYIAVYPDPDFSYVQTFAYGESNEFTIFPVDSGPTQDVSQTSIAPVMTTVPLSTGPTTRYTPPHSPTPSVPLSGILPVLAITTMAVVWSIYMRRQM